MKVHGLWKCHIQFFKYNAPNNAYVLLPNEIWMYMLNLFLALPTESIQLPHFPAWFSMSFLIIKLAHAHAPICSAYAPPPSTVPSISGEVTMLLISQTIPAHCLLSVSLPPVLVNRPISTESMCVYLCNSTWLCITSTMYNLMQS